MVDKPKDKQKQEIMVECPKCKSVMLKAFKSNRYRCSTKKCTNYSQRFR
jgi:hypothetical protein